MTDAQAQQLTNVNAVLVQTAKNLGIPDAGVPGKAWANALAVQIAAAVKKVNAS